MPQANDMTTPASLSEATIQTYRQQGFVHLPQIIGPEELRCRLSPSGDLFRIHAKMEQRGVALPRM